MHPRPPENVRAVMADGREIPLDCVHVGVKDGIDRWEATWALSEQPAHILIGMLPAHCAVSLCVQWEE
jgi:hypothetical protein